jgi:glycosyltransferase involved in cell wall biosynthesis
MQNEFLPGISVVIPTRNRSKLISALLDSLNSAAKSYRGPSEIILIDDSSPDEAAIIRMLCQQEGALYLAGPPSVRQKRNIGIQHATYPIVLFVDSDCQATTKLFGQHARIYLEAEKDVAGVVGVTEFVGRNSLMWNVISRTQFLNAFSFARRLDYAPWATCTNTSYLREVLNEVGGFEVGFPFRLGGDDVDLGLRLNKSGYRIKCNPEAEVFHTRETWDSFGAVWKRAFRWGRMDLHLYYRKHSDRTTPGLPKFSHIFLMLSLAGVILSIAKASAWHLLLPFVWAALSLVLQGVATVRVSQESWRYLPHEMLADMLGLAFEFGTVIEAIRRLEPSVFYKAIQRGPVLPGFVQSEWQVQTWSMWFAIIATLILFGALR